MEMREELEALLFGDGVIEKFNPDPADISPWRKGKYKLSPKQRRTQNNRNFGGKKKNDTNQRAITAGLSAVGAAAGVGGLAYGAHDMGRAVKAGRKIPLKTKALVPLEVAGLGGELMATKILHGDVKHKKKIQKRGIRWSDSLNIGVGSVGAGAGVISLTQDRKQTKEIKSAKRTAQRARLVAAETGKAVIVTPPTSKGKVQRAAAKGAYKGYKQPIGKGLIKRTKKTLLNAEAAAHNANIASQDAAVIARRVRRATGPAGAAIGTGIAAGGYALGTKHDKNKAAIKGRLRQVKAKIKKVEFSGELSKLDADKRQVFGWASITKIDGQDVYDKQGDYIALDEIEKSAYHYVTNSRQGGDMHKREGERPLKVSDMVESFVVTPEKLEKMGLDPDSLPHGWWVGYQINDDAVWQDVKDGKRLGFSIHGKGVRTPMEA